MIDAYAIGTTLKLHDLVTPQLLKLAEQFAKVDALALQVNKRLQKIGSEVVGIRNLAAASKALDAGLKGVNTEALQAERNLRSIKGALPTGSIGIERELAAANVEAATLERRLLGMRGLGRGGSGAVPPILPGLGGAGGGGGRGRRGGHIHGGNMHVGPHGFGIGGVGMGLATDMLVPLAAAGATVYVGHKFYEAAKDYDMAFTRFRTLNLGEKINADANSFARGTKQFGVSMTERMTVLRDMHEVMGNYEEAKEITPLFTRMLAANRGVFGEEGNRFDTKTFQALGKVIEMRGGTASPAEMFKQADFAQKVLTGSAGLVTPTDLLAFMKTGGVATRLLSNKAFYEESAPMIQEMGGNRFGTALMSAHQNLAMGRGSLKSLKEAARIGLIDPGMIEYTKIGTIKQVLPGALKEEGLYNQSKFEWLLKVLIPAIRKGGVRTQKGILKGDAISDEQIVNELNTLFSQRTASNAFAQMYLQRHKIEKNIGVTEGAMGIKELEKQYQASPQGAEDEFAAAWKDFKAEFGKNMLPQVTNMLKTGADILRALGDMANNPTFKAVQDFAGGAVHAFAWPYRLMFGNANASEAAPNTGAINPVANRGAMPSAMKGSVHLDGRLVGSFMADHMGRQASAPMTGTSNFDVSMGLPAPGLGYQR
ncbi:hypothetical protein KDW54_06710 [Burkholderia ambifaria]|uniref:hypothetical protein n=1 Tax=Burkholderia ambifaria TaxID=152480 RepID=UPI001BA2E5BA|nr:hypothetical protein [Burkholderia ambifaria]MBR8182089.1 hypothetical protein [Burkholderia ambifaria]